MCSKFSSPIPLLFLCRKFVTRRWETCSTCCSNCRHLCPWIRLKTLFSSRSELQREEGKVIVVLLLFVDCVYSSVSSSVFQTFLFDGFTFNVYICCVPYFFVVSHIFLQATANTRTRKRNLSTPTLRLGSWTKHYGQLTTPLLLPLLPILPTRTTTCL